MIKVGEQGTRRRNQLVVANVMRAVIELNRERVVLVVANVMRARLEFYRVRGGKGNIDSERGNMSREK